jgi:preprotein translocase subunit SecE
LHRAANLSMWFHAYYRNVRGYFAHVTWRKRTSIIITSINVVINHT